MTFHVLNRGVRRLRLFDDDGDYSAFLTCLAEAQKKHPVSVFAYCVMPNHFHLVVRPEEDGQLSDFMHVATGTHAKRWHSWRGSAGTGAVYQSRYRSLPVQSDRYFLTVCRYVEQNALRAGLVDRAEDWPWSSLSTHCRNLNQITLQTWPVLKPVDWLDLVNNVAPGQEIKNLRNALKKGVPLGEDSWVREMATRLNLQAKTRPRGRPREWLLT